jgi:hypothetical protein
MVKGLPQMSDEIEMWHADDCGGMCDGCGHIAADGFWYNAPCPDDLLKHQIEWAENGVPNAVRPE